MLFSAVVWACVSYLQCHILTALKGLSPYMNKNFPVQLLWRKLMIFQNKQLSSAYTGVRILVSYANPYSDNVTGNYIRIAYSWCRHSCNYDGLQQRRILCSLLQILLCINMHFFILYDSVFTNLKLLMNPFSEFFCFSLQNNKNDTLKIFHLRDHLPNSRAEKFVWLWPNKL